MATVSYREALRIYLGSDHAAIDKLDLEVVDDEFMILVDPSGCDRLTSFRMLAGLEEVNSGSIFVDGHDVTDLSPEGRDIVMVFQNYALYPHMTVADNMGFTLKMQNVPKVEREGRVGKATYLLGLEGFLSRKPRALPGGRRQHVATSRTVIRQPQVLLMDESLSNLDAKLRVPTRIQIAVLQRRPGVITVYVTHDQVETTTMGDRVAVVKNGVLQQVDSLLALYDTPKNLFVAGFIGSPTMSLMESVMVDGGIQIGDYAVPVVREILAKVGGETTLTLDIRPESSRIATDGQGIGLDIVVMEELGANSYLYDTPTGLSGDELVGAQQIVVWVSTRQASAKGDVVRLAADPESVYVFSSTAQERISRNA